MKRKIFYGIICIILVALVIIVCYSMFVPAKKYNSIRVGYGTANIDGAPFYVAYTKGFFTEHGIQVETIPLSTGSEVKLAISAGQVDVAFTGAASFFTPISKGVPIKIISPMATAKTYLYVRPDNKTRTFKDLEGKTIAFLSLGGSNELEVRRILKKEKLDISKINFVSMDKVSRPIALIEKRVVDAVPIDQSEVPKYSELGAVLMEEWGTKGYDSQNKPESVIAINEEFKRSHPQEVDQFIDALIEGHRFIKSNPKEAAEIVAAYIKNESGGAIVYSPEDLNAMWENKKIKYTLWYDPVILVDMTKIAAEMGLIDSNLTLDQIYDLSYEDELKDTQNEIYSTK